MKLFRILENDINVLGDIGRDNAIWTNIEKYIHVGPLKSLSIDELEINEKTYAKFRSCGTTGTYAILRVE